MNFWVFGDSFASTAFEGYDWFGNLTDKFKGEYYYNYFCDARDTQTIMDSFYRNLCNITDDSFVVVWLPSLARLRYPKKEELFETMYEASFDTNGKTQNGIPSNFDVTEYFNHWPYENYPEGTPRKELDYPFDTFDYFDLNLMNNVSYIYHNEDGEEISRKLRFGVSPPDFYKFIQVSKATQQNWNSIFKSLKNFCKFEILFVSWTDEYDTENVVGRTQLTEEIGFWHTKHDEYIETNGKSGIEWDEHFSKKMNNSFSSWIENKYPKYFNT